MNARTVATTVSILAGLVLLFAVAAQRRELANTRGCHQRLFTQLQTKALAAEVVPVPETVSARPSPELLALRSKVTQLMARKNQLGSAPVENGQLQTQLAARGTNASALPPDYIRARDAQWVGAGTVENTVQSFLWSLRHHDTNALFQLLSAKSAESLAQTLEHLPAEDFFTEASLFPGMRIVERKPLPDGSIEAKVEMLPGQPEPGLFHFQFIQGQWKMDLP